MLLGRAHDALEFAKRALADARADGGAMLYRQALALATELGMRPLVARCHAGLAGVYRRIGKSQQVDEHFGAAMAMHQETGMTYWIEKLEAAIAER